MTAGTMGRLFIVPALIVCVLLAVAVVVLLFGTTSIQKPQSVAELLATLEQGAGERTLGHMLMPADKAYWQAAQTLSRRLAEKDKYLTIEQIEPTAQRLIAILDGLPAEPDATGSAPSRRHFLMMALARLQTASGAARLVKLLDDPVARNRVMALRALAEMREAPRAGEVLRAVLARLEDKSPEVQLVACAAAAALAQQRDPEAIGALAPKLDSDRTEIQWNAATSLARLGSGRGKLVLMNMLDRAYWEAMELDYLDAGVRVRRRFSPAEVSNNLKSAIQAASHLDDAELGEWIAKLREDSSFVVRQAARAACENADPDALHGLRPQPNCGTNCGTGVSPVSTPPRRRCHRILRELRRFSASVARGATALGEEVDASGEWVMAGGVS